MKLLQYAPNSRGIKLTHEPQQIITRFAFTMPFQRIMHQFHRVRRQPIVHMLFTGGKYIVGTAALLGGSLAFEIYVDRLFGPAYERPSLDSRSLILEMSKDVEKAKAELKAAEAAKKHDGK